jgi:hypothetical protein
MWKVKVDAINRKTGEVEKKEFVALDTYTLTPEQKLLWNKLMGERTEEVKVTNMRIKVITEMKLNE